MNILLFIICVIVSYLFASIPFGLVYAGIRGVDIRKVGSGNIGATNVSREFGFLGGFLPVFIMDAIKGALFIILIRFIGVQNLDLDIAMGITAIACILGSIFPVYLGFKGGKGVTTSVGVFIIISPYEVATAGLIFLIVLFAARALTILTMSQDERKDIKFFKNLQKNVGISSVIAAVSFPFSVYLIEPKRIVILLFTIILAALIIIRHKNNILNMIQGKNK